MPQIAALGWLIVGGLLGWLNALMQIWSAAQLRPERGLWGVAWIVGGALLRWTLVAGLLILALRQAPALALWAFAGLWLARWIMVWRVHRKAVKRADGR